MCRHWITSVQSGVVETCRRISVHARILTESDPCLEISIIGSGRKIDWPFLSCSLSGMFIVSSHEYNIIVNFNFFKAMSPDGESIVTGAGDETLRFWNVFSKARSQKEAKSALDLFSSIR